MFFLLCILHIYHSIFYCNPSPLSVFSFSFFLAYASLSSHLYFSLGLHINFFNYVMLNNP